MTTPKGNGRDLLARRMLSLEREQAATNARLDITNLRLEKLELTVEAGFKRLGDELAEFTKALGQLTTAMRERIEDVHQRVTALEGQA